MTNTNACFANVETVPGGAWDLFADTEVVHKEGRTWTQVLSAEQGCWGSVTAEAKYAAGHKEYIQQVVDFWTNYSSWYLAG